MARKSISKAKTAAELFYDRQKPRLAFWQKLLELESDPQGQSRVVTYYGEGGIGKTWLLAKIEQEVDDLRNNRQKNDSYLPSSDLDFDFNQIKAEYIPIYYSLETSSDLVELLCHLRLSIFRKKPDFNFPVFDFAIKKYEKTANVTLLPDLKKQDSSVREIEEIYSKVSSALSIIPGLSTIKALESIKSLGDIFKGIINGGDLANKIISNIKDPEIKESIEEINKKKY